MRFFPQYALFMCFSSLWLAAGCTSTASAPTETATDGTRATTAATSEVSSSSSGASEDRATGQSSEVEEFVRNHQDRIKTDMALGGGEYLTALALLLKIPPAQHQDFFALTQRHFAELYGSDQTAAREMLTRLDQALAASGQFHN